MTLGRDRRIGTVKLHSSPDQSQAPGVGARHGGTQGHNGRGNGASDKDGLEGLPAGSMENAVSTIEEADVFLIIGTSGVVYPAAGLAQIAKASGVKVIVVNLEDTPQTSLADIYLQGPAAQILPQLISD